MEYCAGFFTVREIPLVGLAGAMRGGGAGEVIDKVIDTLLSLGIMSLSLW